MTPSIILSIILGLFTGHIPFSSYGTSAPKGVKVTYVFVPKSLLSEAVEGEKQALEIEASWLRESIILEQNNTVPNPRRMRYALVLFIENSPKFALWGVIGIPVPNQRNPVRVNVSLSPGYSGTYVIDGGGSPLLSDSIPVNPKPYDWLEVHTH